MKKSIVVFVGTIVMAVVAHSQNIIDHSPAGFDIVRENISHETSNHKFE